MKKYLGLLVLSIASLLAEDSASAYPHDQIKQYSMHGNFQKGISTKSMGAKQFEVWEASLAVGSKTPRHVHDTEEVFILLEGELLVIIGEQEVRCKAPATLICPANIPHQLINEGNVPTRQIAVLGIDSKISDASGDLMTLPWR